MMLRKYYSNHQRIIGEWRKVIRSKIKLPNGTKATSKPIQLCFADSDRRPIAQPSMATYNKNTTPCANQLQNTMDYEPPIPFLNITVSAMAISNITPCTQANCLITFPPVVYINPAHYRSFDRNIAANPPVSPARTRHTHDCSVPHNQ